MAAAAASTAVVSLSGLHTDERQRLAAALRKLGGVRVLAASHTFERGTTHVVMPELKRSDKAMAAMAAGAWVVLDSWVADSALAGKLLDPAPYEAEDCASGAISPGAPRHWRLRRAATGAGAFSGLRVVLHGAFEAPGADTLERMVTAGGGAVLRKAPPYEGEIEAAGGGGRGAPHAAVVAAGKGAADKWVRAFKSAGIPCVAPSYLVDWLAHPWEPLGQRHRLPGSPAPGSLLARLEAARREGAAGGGGDEDERSVSF